MPAGEGSLWINLKLWLQWHRQRLQAGAVAVRERENLRAVRPHLSVLMWDN